MSRWLADRSGATAIEYGLIISLVFLAAVTAMSSFGTNVTTRINHVSNTIVGAGS